MTREQFITDMVGPVLGDANTTRNKLANVVGKVFDLFQPVVETVAANKTLTAADSGKVFLVTADTTFTLPATVAGLRYTLINGGATTTVGITISPVAADGISGTITLASSVVVDAGVVDKDLINTKGTTQAGDNVTILGTGVTGVTAWVIEKVTGIWAAQS